MGNYQDFDKDFVIRTMNLIDQYEDIWPQFKFEQQYNYTLLFNCLLGLIVLPKEHLSTSISNDRLTNEAKISMGLNNSVIENLVLREDNLFGLIEALRHSVAHFDFRIASKDDNNRIDQISFWDQNRPKRLIASFEASELLDFLRYYTTQLLLNLERHQAR